MNTRPLNQLVSVAGLLALTVGCEHQATGPDGRQAGADRTDADVAVIESTSDNLDPSTTILTLTVDDPTGDPTGAIDVVRMQMDFDPTTGDYEVRLDAHPASPFTGEFRVNINLLNVDEGVQFADAGNDFDLAVETRQLMLTGTSANLIGWSAGDEITTNSLCNLGPDPRFTCSTYSVPNPPGVTLFRSAVLGVDFTFLSNEDVIAFADYAQPAVLGVLTPQQRLVRLGNDVIELVDAGVLTENQADGLTDKLVEAALSLLDGREHVAIRQLRSFMRQVRGLAPRHLSEARADLLLDQARALIAQIED